MKDLSTGGRVQAVYHSVKKPLEIGFGTTAKLTSQIGNISIISK